MQIYLLTTFSMKYKKLDLHFYWLFFLPLTLFSQSFAIDPCHQLRVKVFGAHVPN